MLAAARDGAIALAGATDPLLAALDDMRAIVDSLDGGGGEPPGDDSALFARLEAMLSGAAARGEDGRTADVAPGTAREEAPADPRPRQGRPTGVGEPPGEDRSGAGPADVPEDTQGDVAAGARSAAADAPEADAAPAPGARPEGSGQGGEPAASLRVPVALLDALVAHVSELVLTRNQLLRLGRQLGSAELDGVLQRLDQVTGELREAIMKTRMQPISQAWTGLPRLVRDLARELGRSVRLVTEGGATELDRQMLDALREPLTHLVRNAVDHGIEPPAERRAAGKPETGLLRISAHQDGAVIVVTVEDDGRGLDLGRIRARAVERGLLSAREAAALGPREAAGLIFRPGFSTAATVSRVSGRGVGMDVVKSRIEGIGGKVEIEPREGGGTRVRLTLPLTLAIVPALLVDAAGLPFAVPQLAVEEVVRLDGAAGRRLERIDGRRVLRLRDSPLPLVSLAGVLGYPADEAAERFALVLSVAGRRLAVAVERIRDTEEIVVEPPSPATRRLPALGGTTILGDGSVAVVLEPRGLSGGVPCAEARTAAESGSATAEVVPLLRFVRDGRLQAVPLAAVQRIHRLARPALPAGPGQALALLDGEPVPVIPEEGGAAPQAGCLVLVLTAEDRRFAFAIGEVVDVLEEALEPNGAGRRDGILGCAVVGGTLTEIVDVAFHAERLFGPWTQRRRREGPPARVLVVDDSRFFRELLTPLLRGAGFDVRSAASAREALELLESGERFALVLSDIEMPEMDGFAFARSVRTDPRFAGLPMIALSARAAPEDVARAREAGFLEHVAKLDRARLLSVLEAACAVSTEGSARRGAAA
ncbi:Chemotaxis protein CheA [bacterium HR39]|nr:Chemotaxis protein CheA [bacterium HR39]